MSFNTSSVNLEGGPSYVHLDDYIEWDPPGVIPRVFPLMSGHTVTLNLLETVVKAGRARRAPMRCDSGASCLAVSPGRGDSSGLVPTAVTTLIVNALTGLGICSELAFGLYALTTTRE